MAEKQTAWQRLEALILWAGMTTNSFARHIGLARGENLYQIKRGNNGISLPLAERIITHFPEIDKLWLLTGEGHMMALHHRLGNPIPYYNTDLETSLREVPALKAEKSLCLPQLPDCDLAINYLGRAMGKNTPAGTVVILKKIAPEAIIPGAEYAIVTKKFITLRIVRRGKRDEQWRLVAIDTKHFDEVCITKEEIEQIYAVCGKLIVTNS